MLLNLVEIGYGNLLKNLFLKKSGGANEIRTRDLLHAMQTRYQLRYSPLFALHVFLFYYLKLDNAIFLFFINFFKRSLQYLKKLIKN